MAWHNADGLYIQYGTEKTTPNAAGEYFTLGSLKEVEAYIDLTTLTTSDSIISDTTFIPKGVRIEEVQVVTLDGATTSDSAALNVGLIQTNRSSVIDDDGLVEALAASAMSDDGETTSLRAPVSGTSVGDLIGTTTANVALLIASTSTGTFTAGEVLVRIRYMQP